MGVLKSIQDTLAKQNALMEAQSELMGNFMKAIMSRAGSAVAAPVKGKGKALPAAEVEDPDDAELLGSEYEEDEDEDEVEGGAPSAS